MLLERKDNMKCKRCNNHITKAYEVLDQLPLCLSCAEYLQMIGVTILAGGITLTMFICLIIANFFKMKGIS